MVVRLLLFSKEFTCVKLKNAVKSKFRSGCNGDQRQTLILKVRIKSEKSQYVGIWNTVKIICVLQ